MIRTQVMLTEDQHRRLKSLAEELGVSLAELVRRGVDRTLEAHERERRWRRLWEVVGAFESEDGANDVATEHDRYLAEIYAGGPRAG